MAARTRFGERLKQLRKACDLTQAALAARSGYAISTVRKLESGARRPSHELALDLADALDLDAAARAELIRIAREAFTPGLETANNLRNPPLDRLALPAPTTPLVGRDRDVAQISLLLQRDDVRLLTLLGTGGIGKTRLALAAAVAAERAFPASVYLVSLASMTDPASVPFAIWQALCPHEPAAQDPLSALLTLLRDRKLLLILDNMEHLVATAPALSELLTQTSRVTILATSRAPLHIYGEHRYPVLPLDVPDAAAALYPDKLLDWSAVRLFVDRAQAVVPRFRVTATNAASIAAICRRLAGLPLAIELAAARTSVLPPAALLDRLDQQGVVLAQRVGDLPERLQSLHAALDWSYSLLDEREQAVFCRLAVFVGGCTLDAAEAICGDHDQSAHSVLDVLANLIEHSLVLSPAPDGDTSRYALLEPIREYARERLAERRELALLCQRHASYFAELAEGDHADRPEFEGPGWMSHLEHEQNNLRAALTWAENDGDDELAMRLGASLGYFWLQRGHWSEGRDRLEALLRRFAMPKPGRRWGVLMQLAKIYGKLGDYQAAEVRAAEALTLSRAADDRTGCARSLSLLGSLALQTNRYEQAATNYAGSLAIARDTGDTGGVASMLFNLWILAVRQSDFRRGRQYLEESTDHFRSRGDTLALANALTNLGAVRAEIDGRYDEARRLSEESVAIFRRHGDIWGLSYALNNLGEVLVAQGLHTLASACFDESLALAREHDNEYGVGLALVELGNIEWHAQSYAAARDLYRRGLKRLRVARKPVEIAATLHCLGRAMQSLGEDRQAIAYYADSLAMFWEHGLMHCLPPSLAGLAYLAARRGQPERAALVLGVVDALIPTLEFGMQIFYADRLMYEHNVAATRALAHSDSCAAAYRRGQELPLDRAIAEALSLRQPAGAKSRLRRSKRLSERRSAS